MDDFIKSLIVISLAFVFLPFAAAGCANAQAGGVLTDKAALTQLEKQSGKKFGEDGVCFKRLNESAKIVVVGVKGEDSICRYHGMFVDFRYFEEDNLESSKTALALLGWEKANRQQREKLAKLWVEKVLLAFSAGDNQTFAAVSSGDGKIEVIVSLQFPPGVTSRHAPQRFVFDKDGVLTSKSGN